MAADSVVWPREAAKFIASKAVDVQINSEKLKHLCDVIGESFEKDEFIVSDWKLNDVNPTVADDHAVDWIFFVDTLNFSFWGAEPDSQFSALYKDKSYTGYFSLCALTQKAIEDGIDITNPKVYASISKSKLQEIFRSPNGIELPLMEERLQILRETGEILLQKFGGSFVNCLKQSNGSSRKLIEIVVANFRSFADEAVYEGTRVALYKRAQILIADIWACFEGKGLGKFKDIDTITMFADYRVPQVLAYFGVLEYSNDLTSRLNRGDMFENKEKQEVEIRGCSIWAVELMKDILTDNFTKATKTPVNSITIDFFLWGYRRKHSILIDKIPFHRVRCIYY